MFPASPPLPTTSNRPFQLDTGIQTSKWILETLVGFRTPWTSQNAGRLFSAFPFGNVNDPLETDFVNVMVVSGNVSFRDSQSSPNTAGARNPTATRPK